MKVLWFSVTPSLYNNRRNAHNGGGWIESLERIVRSRSDIELAVSFLEPGALIQKCESNGVLYYPIDVEFKQSVVSKIYKNKHVRADQNLIKQCLSVISDFKPDLIEIFGSESAFGLLKEHTSIPIVVHIQGSLPPYTNAFYPPGYSLADLVLTNIFNLKLWFRYLLKKVRPNYSVKREEAILRMNNNFMVRTRWDKALVKLYNPRCKTYICSEALRQCFLDAIERWSFKKRDKLIFVSVGSGTFLKGYDLTLKTANLLVNNTSLDFEWRLCGPTSDDIKQFERMVGKKAINIVALGKCSADKVRDELLNADVYIHTAYIDNSPNSICEAQYLGLPIISTYVGGIPSLFQKCYPTDYFIPANDPYYLAYLLSSLDESVLVDLSEMNYKVSHERHNEGVIYNSLLDCYNDMLNL